jgi:hypothetical protein
MLDIVRLSVVMMNVVAPGRGVEKCTFDYNIIVYIQIVHKVTFLKQIKSGLVGINV